MSDERDLNTYLRPGELGLMYRNGEPGIGYVGTELDEQRSLPAQKILAAIDEWNEGIAAALPKELQGDSVLAQVAIGLSLRLMMVTNQLRSERKIPKHNAKVRLTLGRRAAGITGAGEAVKRKAIARYESLLKQGKKATHIDKVMKSEFGISARSVRGWRKDG